MAERQEFYEHEKESFSTFLYNKDEGTVMGRTGNSWGKIGLFYLIFYSFLAGFFAVMLAIFYQTLDTQVKPSYTYVEGSGGSILKNPALGFRPLPRRENVESTLIWYKSDDIKDTTFWTKQLDEFIAPYEGTGSSGQHMKRCSEDNLPVDDQVCIFEDRQLGTNCHKNEDWGYKLNRPCIILKMNRMINWTPNVYRTMDELPDEMPQDLKLHIKNVTENNRNIMPEMVWVSCQGENPADKEYIGPLVYTPKHGFEAFFFPYRKTPGYLSPLVAVEFVEPVHNVLINVECRAWAKNIKHDKSNRLGLVHFELLKD